MKHPSDAENGTPRKDRVTFTARHVSNMPHVFNLKDTMKMQGHNPHAQEFFVGLQITTGTSADSDECALTSICDASHFHQLEKRPLQLNWDVEMEKLFEMAASMRPASRPHGTKHTSLSSKLELPAPVRFCRALRKMAAQDL
jgi:hypothetical protein